MKKATKLIMTAIVALAAGAGAMADSDTQSTSPVVWTWGELVNGSSQLIRTPQGLTATLKTSGLPAGHAMTLWIMIYDNPEACATTPCSPADIGAPGVNFDFHYAGGRIVNDSMSTLSGHLKVGDTSTSGWSEVGNDALIAPLTNPMGAEVLLAIHSHGPAQPGQTLAAQLSTYLGGCIPPFLGDTAGFAQSMSDVPANPGECSTIQLSAH